MKKFLIQCICFTLIGCYIFKTENLKALVPFYYLPSSKNFKKESFSIGKSAEQLLFFGQFKDSLALAKLAVKINKSNEKLWTILANTQIANELLEDALISLNNAVILNPKRAELYFAKSTIYLEQLKIKEAKKALKQGLRIEPKQYRGFFQLGNLYLMEKNYKNAIEEFEKALILKPDFWQAINNIGLAYFEIDNIKLSINFFRKAIAVEENAEPLLALASCLKNENINESILLAQKALMIDPNYVDYQYRKEQLWGEKLQYSTKKLFENEQLTKEIKLAKTKINKTS